MFVKKQRWDDDYVRNRLWKFTMRTHSHQTDTIIFIPSLYGRNQGSYSNGNISWSLLCWRRTAWIEVRRSFCWRLSVEYKVFVSVINWVICLMSTFISILSWFILFDSISREQEVIVLVSNEEEEESLQSLHQTHTRWGLYRTAGLFGQRVAIR